MTIDADLLEILVCPDCRLRVVLTADGGGLVCADCRRVYPIRDGLPIMLVEEAVIAEADAGGEVD